MSIPGTIEMHIVEAAAIVEIVTYIAEEVDPAEQERLRPRPSACFTSRATSSI